MTMVEEFCVFCYGASFTTDEREDAEELLRCSECYKLCKLCFAFHRFIVTNKVLDPEQHIMTQKSFLYQCYSYP